MSRDEFFPITGIVSHKCLSCKTKAKYSGLLYLSNLDPEEPKRMLVRYCPCCGNRVLPTEMPS